MKIEINNKVYNVIIERKKQNKNTYLRIKEDQSLLITTNKWTSDNQIHDFILNNQKKVLKMLENQETKNQNNDGFYYLGKKYDIVICDNLKNPSLGEEKILTPSIRALENWYKKEAIRIFTIHVEGCYSRFSQTIPYPTLKIRRMKSRWGVCNLKTKSITLNLELLKRDTKYLDYVIMHELSHLIYPNHSKNFWQLVEKNNPDYKTIRKEMKEF